MESLGTRYKVAINKLQTFMPLEKIPRKRLAFFNIIDYHTVYKSNLEGFMLLKRCTVMLLLLAFHCLSLNAALIKAQSGIIVGFNNYEEGNNWPIFSSGLDVSADLYVFKNERFFLNPFIGYNGEYFKLKTNAAPMYYTNEASLREHQIRYGVKAGFDINERLFTAAGIIFSGTFSGSYGTNGGGEREEYDKYMLGHDILVCAEAGYRFQLKNGKFVIPLTGSVSYSLTARPANMFEFAVRSGFGVEIGN